MYGNKSKIHHYVAATTESISLQEMIQGQCIAHSAGAYTATLLVMVNVMKGGGRAVHPPSSPAQANFTLITECTPESRRYYSVYSVAATLHGQKCTVAHTEYIYS